MAEHTRPQGKTWTYSMTLHQMPANTSRLVDPPDVDTLPVIETLTGTVEADNYTQAHAKAWYAAQPQIQARARQQRYGCGLGILQVAAK